MPTLNDRAWHLADDLEANAAVYRVSVSRVAGARVIDCSAGGLAAGVMLARVCLADLGEVAIISGETGPLVQVTTDHPARACLASQYAGWQVKGDKYFAMGSGPMRAAYAGEAIFADIPGRETATCAVGVLETKKPPPAAVVESVAAKLNLPADRLTLLFAPAACLPGTLQVVARSVETALHKLHELKFDVTKIMSGHGVAPLPAVAADELAAIGRTNDAILYGGRVTLWVTATDDEIREIGPKVPSTASKDHGVPFAELFARYGDFYKIDPLLFSPAEVTFINVTTGRVFKYGKCEPGLATPAAE